MVREVKEVKYVSALKKNLIYIGTLEPKVTKLPLKIAQ